MRYREQCQTCSCYISNITDKEVLEAVKNSASECTQEINQFVEEKCAFYQPIWFSARTSALISTCDRVQK